VKALSIRQPFAQLICIGLKDVENRTWPTKYRGRLQVHASKKYEGDTLEYLTDRGLSVFNALALTSPVVAPRAV